MKVDLNFPSSNPLPPTSRPVRSTRDVAIPKADTDSATFSGCSLGKISQALSNIPEVRQERIAALKAEMSQGTYEISPTRIADAMLSQATAKLR